MKKILLTILAVAISTLLFSQTTADLKNVELEKIITAERVRSVIQNPNGHIVIVSFSAFCSPCIKELNALSKISEKWNKQYGTKIIAVSNDVGKKYRKRLNRFANKNNFSFELFLDYKLELAQGLFDMEGVDRRHFKKYNDKYRIGNPQTFIISKEGVLVNQKKGYLSGSEKELEKYL